MPVRHTKSCRWRSERRLLHLKPRRGGPALAQGNALGSAVQISPSPERASQSQTAILGLLRPFRAWIRFAMQTQGVALGQNWGAPPKSGLPDFGTIDVEIGNS